MQCELQQVFRLSEQVSSLDMTSVHAASITLLYFAGVADVLGKREETWPLDPEKNTVEQLMSSLATCFPQLPLTSVRVAVNEEFADPGQTLHAGDIVALIPPVSGG